MSVYHNQHKASVIKLALVVFPKHTTTQYDQTKSQQYLIIN